MDKKAVVLIGVQGVGKSTYCRRLEKADPTVKKLSRDDIRFMLFDLNNYADNFESLHDRFGGDLTDMYWTVASIILEQDLVLLVDETHHRPEDRKATIAELRHMCPDIKIEAHYLYGEFERCWERNIKRRPEQIVPRDVMELFHRELVAGFGGTVDPWSVGQTLANEGFDVINLVNAEEYLDN